MLASAAPGMPVPAHGYISAGHSDSITCAPSAEQLTPDRSEMRRAVALLHPEGVVELRAIFQRGKKRIFAGYFDHEHREELVDAAAKLNAEGASIYIAMNPLDPQLLGRYANRIEGYAQATATDANVTARRWLLIDLDPSRPKDTSSTPEQFEAAKACAGKVNAYLTERGWPKPTVAESGNGAHLLYRIDLRNDDASRDLVKSILEALAARFDDEVSKVDRSVFNAARIVKLYGTVANKGDDVAAAPWRLSRLLDVPDPIESVSLTLLEELAAEAAPPKQPKSNGHAAGAGAWTDADVSAFLARGGIEVLGEPAPHDGSSRWRLKRCPFNPEHGPTEAAVFLKPNGVLGFKCSHNSCADKHWADLRELVDGPRATRGAGARPGGGEAVRPEWPIPRPLPEGLPPVQPFDYDLLPPLLRRRVEDIAERMQCPPDFPAVALMVVLASLIGHRCGIAPKRADDWIVIPNTYGAAIGRPGILKSPALAEVMKPLQVLQARAIDDFKSAHSKHEAAALIAAEAERVAKDEIRKALRDGNKAAAQKLASCTIKRKNAEPACRRYVVNDATVEKLGEILNENPNGVLLFRDELNGFFRTLERQGHEADRAFYLECWNGDGSFTYDRIGRGTLHIKSACLSILGGIQPGPLAALVRGLRGTGDDGLLQRFQLAVWPDQGREWQNVDRLPDVHARAAVETLIQRLDQMTPESFGAAPGEMPYFRFGEDAQALFDVWRESLELRLRADTEHPMLEAHLAKYRSLVPSLALILHLVEENGGPVRTLALERAIAWAEYLETHARRIYAPAVRPDLDAAQALAKHIRKGDLRDPFRAGDVYNSGWGSLGTSEEAAAAVTVLEDYGHIHAKVVPTAGRPRTEYYINPWLLTGAEGQS